MSAAFEPVVAVRFADPSAAALGEVLERAGVGREPGPRWRLHGARLLTIRGTDADPSRIDAHPAVSRVVVLDAPLHARWPDPDPEPVRLAGGAALDGVAPRVIAGPCSVETAARLFETAQAVAEAGAVGLRGGAFKPRTSPYDFGGLGVRGLELLAEARERTGLPVVTEVLDESVLDVVAEAADVLQIGSRNMHDASLLFAIGAHPRGRPALLKRGFGATIDELLAAAEYFLLGRLAAGHASPGLILCERGIRTFERTTRFTMDLGTFAEVGARSHLPVIADPSHPAGARALVAPLARAAVAAGALGLLVEVHPEPAHAWCDGEQALLPDEFRALVRGLRMIRA